MAVLRAIESKLEAIFEGVFGRAFRSNVQPVELARKLVKEMDDHRSVSVSRVYVPNEYSVYLAPERSRPVRGLRAAALRGASGLPGRARAPRALRPADAAAGEARDRRRPRRGRVRDRGAARARARARRPGAPPTQPEGGTMIYRPEPRAPQPQAAEDEPEAPQRARVRSRSGTSGTSFAAHPVVIGRSKDCEIRVSDPNVSRRHAEVRPVGRGFTVVDLDSTNGIEVDGKRVRELELTDGVRFTLGSTEIVFSRERSGAYRASVHARVVASVWSRDNPPCPQDRLPRPPLPLHLADRPLRGPRPAAAAGIDDPLAAAGLRAPRPAVGARARPADRGRERRARGGRRVRDRLDRAHASAGAPTTTSRSTATSTPRAATPASSRAGTASTSRMPAPRTARS